MTGLPTSDPSLARVLRRVRKKRGDTQEDVAFEAGLTLATVQRAEGAQVMPSWGTVRAIATALGLSLVELAREVEREEH